MDYERIDVATRGAIVVLTLDRPERLNAWTPQMSGELIHAIRAANTNDAIGAIVVTGSGRAFCAGADLAGDEFAAQLAAIGDEAKGATAGSPRDDKDDWVKLCRASKPLIGAINGPAIGIGLTLVLPFDYLIAAAGAKLSLRFVKMGLVPELASSRFLLARCGWGQASWLALSGATVLAEQALTMGLVDQVVAGDRLLDEAIDVASQLAANPQTAMRMIKDLLTANACESDLDAVKSRELDALDVAARSPEHREAVAAFLEKREPRFR